MNADFQPSYYSYSIHDRSEYRKADLQKCLKEIYRFEEFDRLSPLFDAPKSLIDEFISLSNQVRLTPPNEQKFSELGEWDAVFKATHFHPILFENDTLRILEGRSEPGEAIPFHTHQWDSIMVILQGSRFRIEDREGNISEGEWGPCVEKFDGNFVLEAYTHIGAQPFRAIFFEIKK